MAEHQVVSHQEWQAARDELLAREKEHTRRGDELARERRELPWVAVEKDYRFDTDDGTRTLAEHLHARDVTLLLVSQAPLTRLQAYKRRMGWHIGWVSAANTDFNLDLGASSTAEQVRSWGLDESTLPSVVAVNAAAAGTDIPGYLTEAPTMSAFTRSGDTVYQSYVTAGRGVEFMMGYYPILDRAAQGRDEGDGFQTWIRRHDEYA